MKSFNGYSSSDTDDEGEANSDTLFSNTKADHEYLT